MRSGAVWAAVFPLHALPRTTRRHGEQSDEQCTQYKVSAGICRSHQLQAINCKYLQMDGVLLGTLRFYNVFFLFSSTKIGHSRLSVKNRYAISDKNILRSYVVRYFYLKFLACHPSASWEMYKKKEKKCVPVQCVGSSLLANSCSRLLPG